MRKIPATSNFNLISQAFMALHLTFTIIFISINRILGNFELGKPVLIVRDPETIKQMIVKDFDHFEDHRNFIDDKVSST